MNNNIKKTKAKRDEFILNVTKNNDKEVYKNNIITAMYLHPIIDEKISKMIVRYKFSLSNQIQEDVKHHLFVELCKKTSDYIIERFEEDPNILLGLCVRILVLKVFCVPNEKYNIRYATLRQQLYTYSKLNYQDEDDLVIEYLLDEEEDDDNILDLINESLPPKALNILKKFRQVYLNIKPKKLQSIDKAFFTKKINQLDLIYMFNTIYNVNKNKTEIKMKKEEILNEIEKIKPLIDVYFSTKKINHITHDNIEEIKKVWRLINPASNANTLSSCGTCLKDSLDIIISIYDRLVKKVVKEEVKEDNTIALTFDIKKEEDEPIIKKSTTKPTPKKAPIKRTTRTKK